MGTKHTPGPWAVRGHNSELPQVWDSGFDVCVTDRVFNGNAALIAAAPDLLEACEWAENAPEPTEKGFGEWFDNWKAECAGAIAKARGEA